MIGRLTRTMCEPDRVGSIVLVRTMTPGDVGAVTALSLQLGYHVDLASVDAAMPTALRSPSTAFVAEFESGVVGWVHAYVSVLLQYPHPFVEIGGLVVDGNSRGSGVGRALMEAVEQWALERGLDEVRLRSGAARHDAHKFYESLGYQIEKSSYTFSKRLR